jgi:hypothetical protein
MFQSNQFQGNIPELNGQFPKNGMDKSPMQNQFNLFNGQEMNSQNQGNGKSPSVHPLNGHENKSPVLNTSREPSLNGKEDSKEKKMEKVAKLLENAKSKLAQKKEQAPTLENKPKDLDSLISNLNSNLFAKRDSTRRSYSRHSSDSFSDNSPRKRNSNIPSPIRDSDSSSDGNSSSSSTHRSRSTSYFSRKISYSRSRSPVHRNHRFIDKRSRSNSSERRYSQSSPPPPPPPYSPNSRESSYQKRNSYSPENVEKNPVPDWNDAIPKFSKSKKKNSRYSRDPTRFLFLRQLDLSNLDKQKIFLGKIIKLMKLDFRPFGKIENIILLFNSKCAFIDFFEVDSACSAKSLFYFF